MPELERSLEEYASEIDAVEPVSAAEVLRRSRHPRPVHRWAGALVAAAVTVALILWIAPLNLLSGGDIESADQTPVAPITTVRPETTTAASGGTSTSTTSTTDEASTSLTAPVELVRPRATILEPPPSDLDLSLEALWMPDAAIDESRVTSIVRGGPGLLAVGAVGHEDERYGDAAVWQSADGESWGRLPNENNVFDSDRSRYVKGDQWMADIVAWQGGFVGVGSDGGGQNAVDDPMYDAAVWLSDDGINWTRVPHQESLEEGWMTAVTVGGPGLVAVGEWPYSTEGWGPDPRVWLSEDGINWTSVDKEEIEGADGRTERTPPGWGGAAMADVAVGGPGLIAVGTDDPYRPGSGGPLGGDPSVWVSADGQAWDQILLDDGSSGADAGSSVRRLAVSPNGTIAAVGVVGDLPAPTGKGTHHQMAAVWISEDGFDWQLAGVFEDEYSSYAGAALWHDDTLIVVGSIDSAPREAVVWATRDMGETWYQIARTQYDRPPAETHPVMFGPGHVLLYSGFNAMSDVTTFGSQIVAVGGDGVVWLGSWPPG